MELKYNQAALLLEFNENGEIIVDVTSGDISSTITTYPHSAGIL